MVNDGIRQEIANLNNCLAPFTGKLSTYVFGYTNSPIPTDDGGEPIPPEIYINNGLCHAYALVLSARLTELDIPHRKTGSPSHVWIESDGEWLDSAGVVHTTWTGDFYNYENMGILYDEFPCVFEGLSVLAEILSECSDQKWVGYATTILEEVNARH